MRFVENREEKPKIRLPYRGIAVAGAVCLALMVLSGCGSTASAGGGLKNVFTVGGENCSGTEAKVILIQYQKEYRNFYGIDLWEEDAVDQSALTAFIKNGAISELAWVYALDAAADGLGISLSEEDSKQAQAAAQEYVDSLDAEEKKYLGIDESDARQLYERYRLAERTVEAVLESVPTEVSDAEAQVMDVRQIVVSDWEDAESLLSRIREGEEFTALADSYSESDEIDAALTRTTYDADATEAIFSLEEGECSDVIECDGMYCIFRCETYFDGRLTDENRASVLRQRRKDAVLGICETYADPGDSVFRMEVWSGVELDHSLVLDGSSFGEVYRNYFSL